MRPIRPRKNCKLSKKLYKKNRKTLAKQKKICKFASVTENQKSMIYATLPTNENERRLTFYLAAEEYIARHLPKNDYFFMWQVCPTVIFGRNQLIENEVNIDYCRQHHINTFRRKSGGGCVYADMNNIMFSYITPDENVNMTFTKYIDMVVSMLRKLGVEAMASGRNDIMINGKKVSGNAFYHIPGRSIVHGTMLYDTDMQNMVGSITPSDDKLISKGIQSVRQHITLLKDFIDISIEDFKTFVKKELCDEETFLTNKDLTKIEEIEKEYLDSKFIFGHNPRYNIFRKKRIEGVGELVAKIEIKNDIIKDIDIKGDFFLTGDIGRQITSRLKGIKLGKNEIDHALPDKLDDVILNITKDDFINFLTEE